MKYGYRINKQRKESLFYYFILLFMSHKDLMTLNKIFMGGGGTYAVFRSFIYIALVLLGGISIIKISKMKKDVLKEVLAIYFIFIVLTLITYFFSPDSMRIINEEGLFLGVFFYAMIAYPLLRIVDDWDAFYHVLRKFAYAVVAYGTIILVTSTVGSAYMGFSYAILLYVLVLLYDGIFKKNKVSLVFGIVGTIVNVLGGTRGSLISIGFIILCFFVYERKWKRVAFLASIIILLYLVYDHLFEYMSDLASALGVNSRTLSALKGINMDSLTYGNGRETITKVSFALISQNLLGYGFLGERAPICNSIWWFGTNGYAHNLFLEIVLQFGVFFGAILILLLIFGIIKTFSIKNQDKNVFSFFVIFLSYNLHLLVSRSYTTTFQFWAMIAILVYTGKIMNRRKNHRTKRRKII